MADEGRTSDARRAISGVEESITIGTIESEIEIGIEEVLAGWTLPTDKGLEPKLELADGETQKGSKRTRSWDEEWKVLDKIGDKEGLEKKGKWDSWKTTSLDMKIVLDCKSRSL